jgi:hypothetical protein
MDDEDERVLRREEKTREEKKMSFKSHVRRVRKCIFLLFQEACWMSANKKG